MPMPMLLHSKPAAATAKSAAQLIGKAAAPWPSLPPLPSAAASLVSEAHSKDPPTLPLLPLLPPPLLFPESSSALQTSVSRAAVPRPPTVLPPLAPFGDAVASFVFADFLRGLDPDFRLAAGWFPAPTSALALVAAILLAAETIPLAVVAAIQLAVVAEAIQLAAAALVPKLAAPSPHPPPSRWNDPPAAAAVAAATAAAAAATVSARLFFGVRSFCGCFEDRRCDFLVVAKRGRACPNIDWIGGPSRLASAAWKRNFWRSLSSLPSICSIVSICVKGTMVKSEH
jgi:hypothetical protein